MVKTNAVVGIVGKEEDVSVLGAKRILTEYKIPFDIINEIEIAKKVINYPLLLFPSQNYLNFHIDDLNNFFKNGGNAIFCGLLNFKDANILNIKIKDRISDAELKLKLEDSHPVVSNIEKREIVLIGEVTLIDDCKEYDIVGKISYNNQEYPGIIISKQKNIMCIPFDISRQVILWENEQYAKVPKRRFLDDFMIKIYDALPYKLNQALKRYARKIRRQISKNRTIYTRCPVEYNSDTLRTMLINSIRYQSLKSIGFLPTLSKWPYDYKSAMVITHDIDTYNGYKRGLPILLEIEKKNNIKTTWNFVAQSSEYNIENELLSELISNGYEIASHGLYHDQRYDKISCEEREERMIRSKRIIENKVSNYEIKGFRSPGLARTDDLCFLLDKARYNYDMSFPDNDHYTLSRFGMGVSSHVPYNPIIKIDNGYKELKLLELPLAALQEVNLFIDHKMNEEEAFNSWIKKGEPIIEDEGLVVFLFHPSFFIAKSRVEMYENLVKYFANKKQLWITTASNVVEWWNKRRLVGILSESQGKDEWEIEICNKGINPIEGLKLIVDISKSRKMEIISGDIKDITCEKRKWYNRYHISIPSLKEIYTKKIIVKFEDEITNE